MNSNKKPGRLPILSDVVLYDGRANGPQRGVITRIERIPRYSGDGEMVYFEITGAGTLVPEEDVLEVL